MRDAGRGWSGRKAINASGKSKSKSAVRIMDSCFGCNTLWTATTKPLVWIGPVWFGKPMPIESASPCPDFTLPATPGGQLSRETLAGAPFVLFLYPRDNTSTCTAEALAFSAALPEFEQANCKVIGCSADSIASHVKFQTKHGFNIPLLSDPDHVLIGALGCWVEKQLYGRRYMGISRSSFLYDGNGNLVQAWRDIRIKNHVENVLAVAQAI